MDTRTKILDAALGLLAEGGAQGLTQPRIAKAAGVRQSHLTYYFPTINDLLEGVAAHTVEAMVAEVGRRDPAQRPASFLGVLFGAATDRKRARMMLGLITAADREPKLRERMREFIRELRRGALPMLQAAGLQGTPEQIAFMHSVVVGQAVLHLARDNEEARDEARKVLALAVGFLRQADGEKRSPDPD